MDEAFAAFYAAVYEFMGLTKGNVSGLKEDIKRIETSEKVCRTEIIQHIERIDNNLNDKINTLATHEDVKEAKDKAYETARRLDELINQVAITRAKVVSWSAGATFIVVLFWKVIPQIYHLFKP